MSDRHTIVIVEDDVLLAKSLQRLLSADGFEVAIAHSGAELRTLMDRAGVDLVLLDLNLGGEDGMDIARDLGLNRSAGLIIVTGRGTDSDCVSGLEAGADDFIAKPFDREVLRARIRAVLRRRQQAHETLAVLTAGPYRLDTVGRCLFRVGNSRRVELTATETALVARLMAHAGSSVHRAELSCNDSWSPNDRATDVHMSHIRRKLAEHGMSDFSIRPVRGHGYRLSLAPPPGAEN